MAICGFDFNETQFGWDTCTKKPGHSGDHRDGANGHTAPNTSRKKKRRGCNCECNCDD